MKLTVLGSGTVAPSGERNCAGYFVEADEVRVMLDCGAGTVPALARYGVDWEAMTHLFISHFHVDHIGELASLFFAFRRGMKSERRDPLTLVAPRGIERILHHLKAAFGENLFTPKFPVKVLAIEPGASLELGGECRLTVAKTPHTEESLAVRIQAGDRAIAYTGDTGFSEKLARFFDGVNLLVAECSYREPRPGARHLTLAEVAELAALSRADQLLATHFYFAVNDENEEELRREIAKRYAGVVWFARDGLQIDV